MRAAPTWPDGVMPTAEQWVEWFLASDDEGRLSIASQAIAQMADINHCLSSGACWINR